MLSRAWKAIVALSAVASLASPAADAWTHGSGAAPPTCNITKNIVADFGAVGSGLADDTPAFVGTGSFQDFAVNTYLPVHPNDTICLTIPSGTYLFGTFTGFPIFDGITNLVVNGPNATLSNAMNLTTSAGTAAGNNVLTFSSVPAFVASSLVGKGVVDPQNPAAVSGLTVASANSTTITLSGNVASPGVSNGDTISIAAGGYFLGASGQTFDASHSALTQAVAAGDSSVTLQNPSDASIFSVNTFAALTGVDIQGFGQPQNPGLWEYVFITSVNVSTGVVTFQSPTKFAYKTTWPHYNFGDPFHINEGGPATLYAFPASWNISQIYNIGTIFQWADGTLLNAAGKSITFNNTKFVNWGVNFSQQQSLTLNNPDMASIARLETDKMWDTVTINGGTVEGFFVQSGTPTGTGTLTLNGTHVTSGGISGSPGTMNLINMTSDLGLQMGAANAGYSGTINCTNSSLPGGLALGGYSDSLLNNGSVTMVGGLITVPRTLEAPIPWAVPGASIYLSGNTVFATPFTVIDLTADATNTYVQTSLPSGFPSIAGGHGATIGGSLKVNFSGCTGAPDVVDVSQAGARNAAPFTYSNRIYTCTNNVATVQAANPGVPVIDMNNPPSGAYLARAITSVTVNVSRADTGANPTVNLQIGGQFNNYPTIDATGATNTWGPIINLKTAGTRTYTGASTSWSGSQTGDTLPTLSNPSYMSGRFGPFTSVDLTSETASACPIVTLTAQTN